MELDYSDETITFTKIKTSQKNKTYEMGTDDGYTLVLNNQYISYGLDDSAFELYFNNLYDYYKGFALTPMTFTLAEPDLELNIGDRIQVYDEEEQVTVTGNVSKIEISGNCSMTVTCGGFENVSSKSNYTPTSFSQVQQANKQAVSAERLLKKNSDSTESKLEIDKQQIVFNVGDGNVLAILARNAANWPTLSGFDGFEVDLSGRNGNFSFGLWEDSGIKLQAGNFTKLSISDKEVYLSAGDINFNSNSKTHITRFTDGTNNITFINGNLLINGKKVLTED